MANKAKVKQETAKQNDCPVKLEEMLEAGVHFGHQAKRWNPGIAPYIWQVKDGIHIFDLLKTRELLIKACSDISKEVAEGKTILFVGTKRQASAIVKEQAERAGMPYIVSRWPGGALTNWEQIQKSIKRLNELEDGLKTGKFLKYTKKERVLLDKELNRLKRFFGGMRDLKNTPDALFLVDIIRERTAIKEARHLGLKIYAIVDSNCNPERVDFPIAGNDDAVRSLQLLIKVFADAIVSAKAAREKSQL